MSRIDDPQTDEWSGDDAPLSNQPLAPVTGGLGHRLYHGETAFDFVRKRWIGYTLSGVLILLSVVGLFARGLNLGIDFKGGVSWTLPQNGVTQSQIEDLLSANGVNPRKAKIEFLNNISSGGDTTATTVAASTVAPATTAATGSTAAASATTASANSTVSSAPTSAAATTAAAATTVAPALTSPSSAAGPVSTAAAANLDNGRSVRVQVPDLTEANRDKIRAGLAGLAKVSSNSVNQDQVSSTWGGEVTRKAVISLLVFFLVLAIYITFRFEWKMAIAAICAVIHDVFISVGIYAIFGFPVTPATVIAFLTILGFSLYDTVVVFDKVLDNTKKYGNRVSYADIVNLSMNQVLMRSLNTSIAAILPVLSVLVIGSMVLGAIALQDFALALLVGLVTGSYSSIFIATPILAWLKEREPRYAGLRDRHASPEEIARMRAGEGPATSRARRAASVAGATSAVVAGGGVMTSTDPAAALTHPPRPRKKRRR